MNAGTGAAQLFDAAVDAYDRGDLSGALGLADELLRGYPGHAGALYMSGSLLLQSGRAAEALPRLEAAARTVAKNGELLHALGDAYFQLGRWPESANAYQQAYDSGRSDPHLLNNMGLALKEMGQVDAAIRTFEAALRVAPDDADLHNNLAIALNRRHDYQGAIAAYRRSLELKSRNVDAWSNLATLLEQSNLLDEADAAVQSGLAIQPDDERLQLILARCLRRRGELDQAIATLERSLARTALTPVVRRTMEFELGKAYDLAADADQAFRHFTAGNAITGRVWPALRAGADALQEQLRHHLEVATPEWIAKLPAGPAEDRPSPVFLVSFPRSGTTLMDTMLGAHPGILVLEEEQILTGIVESLQAPGYPEALMRLSHQDILRLRAEYWRGVERVSGAADTTHLVLDKNPLLSVHAGLIHRLFPGARFIFALRHPCDVALSCFMQSFGNNAMLENCRDLDTTALTYSRVMDLWARYREALGLRVHVLRYESLVQDKQAELAKLLTFLGLEWDESMHDHTRQAKKRGRIYTPSYHQVIQPLYGDAVDRWRRYRPYFGTALEKLRPYVEAFGYTP